MLKLFSLSSLSLTGKNPANKKLSVGSPAISSAVIAAQGPGSGTTLTFCFAHKETTLYPGSEIKGVPASLIKATAPPFFDFAFNNFNALLFIMIVTAYHSRALNPDMIKQ